MLGLFQKGTNLFVKLTLLLLRAHHNALGFVGIVLQDLIQVGDRMCGEMGENVGGTIGDPNCVAWNEDFGVDFDLFEEVHRTITAFNF